MKWAKKVKELQGNGIYSALQVDTATINQIMNLDEQDYYDLSSEVLGAFVNLLSRQLIFLQQERNGRAAKLIECEKEFKKTAIPYTWDWKKSEEERWIMASTVNDNLSQLFEQWQESKMDYELFKSYPDLYIERINALKKVLYDKSAERGL